MERWISKPDESVATSSTTRNSLFFKTSFEEITFITLTVLRPSGPIAASDESGSYQPLRSVCDSTPGDVAAVGEFNISALALRSGRHTAVITKRTHPRYV